MTILLIILGLAVLVAGAELLVRGATGLARAARVPTLLIGLTVVAFGTSAPELAVSVHAARGSLPGIALGNVVGSNCLNVLLILGASAAIAPLAAASRLVRLDVPVMIGVSGAVWLLAADGAIGRAEGAALAAGLLAYVALLIHLARRDASGAHAASATAEEERSRRAAPLVPLAVLVVLGLAMLVLGARWFVTGAVEVARLLGADELLIGLTIVAAGTSLPELATSIVAAVRGERDIAIGNVVGSNIFNLLGVLGVSAACAPDGVPVAPAALRFDIPVMTVVAVACLPVFISGGRISRLEGWLFVAGYVAYVTFLVVTARG